MGYTNYWKTNRDISLEESKEVFKALKKHFAQSMVESENELSIVLRCDSIAINGVEDSCEDFYFEVKAMKKGDFDFCKTNRYPYDYDVKEAMIVMQYVTNNGFDCSCDEDKHYYKDSILDYDDNAGVYVANNCHCEYSGVLSE